MIQSIRDEFIQYKRSHNIIGDAIPLEIVLDFLEIHCEGKLPKLISVKEASKLLGMKQNKGYELCRAGIWPVIPVTGSRYMKIDTKKFLELYPVLKPAVLKP